MSTVSIRGKFSKASPGGLSRRGPAQERGLARSPQCGSVRKLMPSNCTKRVAWPIHVILGLTRPARSAVPSTLTRGGGQQNSTWSSPTVGKNLGRYYEIHHQRDAPARLEAAPSQRCRRRRSRTTRSEPQLSRNTQTRSAVFDPSLPCNSSPASKLSPSSPS